MSLVNFNGIFGAGGASSVNSPKVQTAKPSVFTPAPSVETAGSVASSAPASGSFSAVC